VEGGYAFEIHTPDRIYYLIADTEVSYLIAQLHTIRCKLTNINVKGRDAQVDICHFESPQKLEGLTFFF